MSRRAATTGRILAALQAAIALACVVALWLIHLTTDEVARIVLSFAWLLAGCLALAVLVRAVRIVIHGSGFTSTAARGVLPSRSRSSCNSAP
jgi:hypothetical protein